MSNCKEIKEKALADFEERYQRLEEWFMSVKGKGNTNNGFLDLLSNETELNGLPIWRRAFETVSESGEPNDNDIWMLDERRGFLFLIPKGSNTAQCLSLKELLLLPKEEALTNTPTNNNV
jgi:hypothetical protein